MTGAFQVNIVISTREQLLGPEERLLAWLRFLAGSLPATNRWYPVWQRYLEQISGRVTRLRRRPGDDPALADRDRAGPSPPAAAQGS